MAEGSPARTGLQAVVFDLDGVVTRTARVHAATWKATFDAFLQGRSDRAGPLRPFDDADYHAFVDGRPRLDGVRTFLASRGIALPEGTPDDGPDAATVHGLARAKTDRFEAALREGGVEVFATSVRLIRALRELGVRTGVVTSSRHGRDVLAAAGLPALFDARVDGLDAAALGLRGKPEPDAFLRCAALLHADPAHAAVVEDAAAGVEAADRGGFGLVVGVDRGGNRDALLAHGAHVVVPDLGDLGAQGLVDAWRQARSDDLRQRVVQEGYDPAREHEVESLFALSNGHLGVRGALDTPLPASRDDLFLAGVFDREVAAPPPAPALPDAPHESLETALVRLPSPFRFRLSAGGRALDLASDTWRAHTRVLDLRRARLRAETRFETGPDRHVVTTTLRCVSAADPHLLLHEVRVCAENHATAVALDASLAAPPDPTVDAPHLVPLPVEPTDDLDVRRFATRASGHEVCVVARTTLVGSGREATRWQVDAPMGEPLVFRRLVSVFTSRDAADPHAAAVAHARAQRFEAFGDALAAHAARWRQTWDAAGVRVDGDAATEQALRFQAFHLAAAADDDPRASVGARGLTGRAYDGHVFWDVEAFLLPFFLHTAPQVARALLGYRHRTLDGARARARTLGHRGACYAWESTVTGADVTPRAVRLAPGGPSIPVFTGTEQLHVTADVALAVRRYVEATGDDGFLAEAGAEILVETARFWADRAVDEGGTRHLRGVMGPDEYHHAVDDSAYTNWLARENLRHAAAVARRLAAGDAAAWGAIAERCGVTPDEPDGWDEAARTLWCPEPGPDGVIEQFAGFFDLEEPPPRAERRPTPVRSLVDWDRLQRVKLVKQADVLMLLHVLPEAFPPDVVAANYRFYEPLTDHGSSLSPPIHAAIAARLGLTDDALRYWRESLRLDLSDTMGNAALGVHLASMGGTWQALVAGFLGVRLDDDGAHVDPAAAARLPASWGKVSLRLLWRGRSHLVEVAAGEGP